MLYFIPIVLSAAIVFALLGFVGHWLGGREIARRRRPFAVLVGAGSVALMPVLAGMTGHPPVPYLMPLVAAIPSLLRGSGGLVLSLPALIVGFAVGLSVFAMAAYGRASRTY